MDLDKISAQITSDESGQNRLGTAWLCSKQLAITAAHCIGDTKTSTYRANPAWLHFPQSSSGSHAVIRKARVVIAKWELDVALLELEQPVPDLPADLRFGKLEENQNGVTLWKAFGFPTAHPAGLTLDGSVTAGKLMVDGEPTIQLACNIGGYGNLDGASGAAVVVDGKVVGVITTSVSNDRVILARSLQEIRERTTEIDAALSGRALNRRRGWIPSHDNPLQGRQDETAKVVELLLKSPRRGVVITGTPGVGKSALAINVAAQSADYFPDGQYYVDLRAIPSELPDPAGIEIRTGTQRMIKKLANTVGIHLATEGELECLEDFCSQLRTQRLVFLLDNLAPASHAATRLGYILDNTKELKLLVTASGTIPRLDAYHLESLPFPSNSKLPLSDLQQIPSFALYVAEAIRCDNSFDIRKGKTAQCAAELCCETGGLPLAIMVLAARTPFVTTCAILDDWKKKRHFEHLFRAFEFAYHSLNSDEQKLLRGLSVFGSSCERHHALDFARAILAQNAAPEACLDALAATNLLDHSAVDDIDRYQLPQALRRFALAELEKCGESAVAFEAYSRLYVDLVEELAPKLTHSARLKDGCLDRLRAEEDNIRELLHYHLENAGRPSTGLRIAGHLFWFWNFNSSFEEGTNWLLLALDRNHEAPPEELAPARYGLGGLRFLQGRYKEAEPLISACVSTLAGTQESACRRILAYATVIKGMLELFLSGDKNAAKQTQKQSCELMTEIGDNWGLALSTSDLGRASMRADKYSTAKTHFNRALNIWERLDDPWGMALTWTAWGEAAIEKDPELARKLLNDALKLYPTIGDRWGEALALLLLGKLSVARAELEVAESLLKRSLTIHRIIGRRQLIGECIEMLGDCSSKRGDFARAAFLFGAAQTLKQEVQDPKQLATSQSRLNKLRKQAISSNFPKARFNLSLRAGQGTDRDKLITLALESTLQSGENAT